MNPFATIDDLTLRFPRALTPAEIVAADTLLLDASFMLSILAPGVQAAVEDGTNDAVTYAAMLATVTMVSRTLLARAAQQPMNPAVDQVSQTFGPYSSSVKYSSNGGSLWLSDGELRYLLELLGGENRYAVSMRSKGL